MPLPLLFCSAQRILLSALIAPVFVAFATTAHAETPWRPFSADSPWNQRITADAPTDRDSAALIEEFASRGALFINIKDWSIPVYFIDADRTPKHDVGDLRPGVYGAGFSFPRQIPIPTGALASPPTTGDSDQHLCIVDKNKNLEWGLWWARQDEAGRWWTGLGAVTDLSGTGVAPPWFAAEREFDAHRARASGFPLIAGLILRDEIAAGRIEHALVFAYDRCRSAFFIPPASTAQVTRPEIRNASGIPMGGRIQLDPAWDVEHSGLSRSGRIIARALQEYGAYCGDFAGANVLYAENSPEAVAAWSGVLDQEELARVFTPEMIRRHFRVIAMGNVLPGQNLEVPGPYVLTFTVEGTPAPAEIDHLTRTITVPRPKVRPHAARVNWSVHPRDTRVHVQPEAATATDATVDLTDTTRLILTAPDGQTATWTVVGREPNQANAARAPRRFFAESSFWNQPLPANPEIDPRTPGWIKLLESEPTGENFLVNSKQWTIPVYEVDRATPVHEVGLLAISPEEKIRWHTSRATFGHGPGFDYVPIPPQATPDPKADSHLAVVDWERNLVWDMWALSRNPDGTWKSATGMVYAADGSGVFSTAHLGVQDGESVHFHGPSRAAGVPAVAGLIRYDEVEAGEIRHKIAAASRFCAYKEFVFPAAWTDGFTEGGIPEGTVIQLDPTLDLNPFQLTREERIVCVALQRYGMVLVDIAQGQPVYAEGLWGHPGKSWDGKLDHGAGGLSRIPYRHFRMLKAGPVTRQGDGRSKFAPVWENP